MAKSVTRKMRVSVVFSPRYSIVASIGGFSISGSLGGGGVGVAGQAVVSMATIPFSCFMFASE